jgi:putative Mn2+ efflux pump MntP
LSDELPTSEKNLEQFIRPIVNASYPAVLAGLSLAALQIGTANSFLKYPLIVSALCYLLASFSVFFFTIYQSKRFFWIIGAASFLVGLVFSVFSVLLLLVI